MLLHELLLVEFLLLLWTAPTCAGPAGLVYGLTAQAAHVLDRLMARLLVGSGLLGLLLEKLHLLLLVVGQHRVILHMGSGHCTALLFADEHL